MSETVVIFQNEKGKLERIGEGWRFTLNGDPCCMLIDPNERTSRAWLCAALERSQREIMELRTGGDPFDSSPPIVRAAPAPAPAGDADAWLPGPVIHTEPTYSYSVIDVHDRAMHAAPAPAEAQLEDWWPFHLRKAGDLLIHHKCFASGADCHTIADALDALRPGAGETKPEVTP